MNTQLATNGMSADVAALLGTKEGIAEAVKPKYILGTKGPALDPHKQINPKDDEGLKEVARMMVDDKTLSVTSFLSLAQPFNVKQVVVIDGVLVTMRANKAGVFGELVLDTNYEVRHMQGYMPRIDPKFAQRVKDGLAKPQEIINFVVRLTREIERALKGFDNMLEAVQENENLMEGHYKSAYELVLKCVELGLEQDERTEKLLKLLALVDYLQKATSARLEKIEVELAAGESQELTEERAALNAVSPLIIRRTQNVTPMVLQGNVNQDRFLKQTQVNAINALDLRDYIDVHLVQIKTDIVTGLLAVQSQANMFAIRTGIDLAKKVSAEANEKYAEQISQAVDLIVEMMGTIDDMEKLLQSTLDVGNKLYAAFEEAADNTNTVSRQVEKGRKTLKKAEESHFAQIRKIMKQNNMEMVEEEPMAVAA